MPRNKNEILINYNPFETRVALLESGRLVEFYVERAKDRSIVGNIYKGRVEKVLPGIQAAFVNMGLERTAFLHAADVYHGLEDFDEFIKSSEEEEPDTGARLKTARKTPIQDIIKEGQEILVQIAKEPIGEKGARITSHISLPGRQLVLMPTDNRIGVSRRISNEKERKRLKDIVLNLKPPDCGFIIRTACDGMKEQDIRRDMEYLVKLWDDILRRKGKTSAPAPLYHDLDITMRTIRDQFTSDIDKLIIDSEEEYKRALRFVEDFLPYLKPYVEFYDGVEPLFDSRGIEVEISAALERKVWLKSGGYIIIDQAEALTAIDVNTGKYVGKKTPEETVLKTNLEAVKEVVYQLRLRNIGGIIVVDFIDMEKEAHREKVYNALKEALKGDRARTNILKVSELGLVEMTRKRVRDNLSKVLCKPCHYCEGSGIIKSGITTIMAIYRELVKELPRIRRRKIYVYVNPVIAGLLYSDESKVVEELEQRFKKKVFIKTVSNFHQEQYEVS
ncbi:MAG: ribonuclease G [Deltaproteobacteria bacterium GWC2_42_11]|nr:MAG: ribonuclease G [Deltaproteobacteria bacterium GWC2_42_11]HBO84755.1 Rne/Rng family ribonuclease [Deltaproteobacteria bacterium]